jgi:hypothetical protein
MLGFVAACWDCEFESWNGILSLVSVVCCQIEITARVCYLDKRSPTECVRVCVCVCVFASLQRVGRQRSRSNLYR